MTSRDHRPLSLAQCPLKREAPDNSHTSEEEKRFDLIKGKRKMGSDFSRFSTDALAARQYTDDQGCEAASNGAPPVSAISLIQIGFSRSDRSLPLHTTPPNDPRREGSPVAPVASRFTLGSCRLMDTKAARTVALAALLIYVTGTASALCDGCPCPFTRWHVDDPVQSHAAAQSRDAWWCDADGPAWRNLRPCHRYV